MAIGESEERGLRSLKEGGRSGGEAAERGRSGGGAGDRRSPTGRERRRAEKKDKTAPSFLDHSTLTQPKGALSCRRKHTPIHPCCAPPSRAPQQAAPASSSCRASASSPTLSPGPGSTPLCAPWPATRRRRQPPPRRECHRSDLRARARRPDKAKQKQKETPARARRSTRAAPLSLSLSPHPGKKNSPSKKNHSLADADDAPTIFDKIISKAIPADVVYEDDQCLAFRDIQPQAPVHVVLIPKSKQGLARLSKADASHKPLLGHLLWAAQEVAKQEGLLPGFRVVINDGPLGC